jgi:hypothetical protein
MPSHFDHALRFLKTTVPAVARHKIYLSCLVFPILAKAISIGLALCGACRVGTSISGDVHVTGHAAKTGRVYAAA